MHLHEIIKAMDIRKPETEVADYVDKKSIVPLDEAHQESAVGYKEYLEALELDISEKEVSECQRNPSILHHHEMHTDARLGV